MTTISAGMLVQNTSSSAHSSDAATRISATTPAPLSVLQIGAGWFPENAGGLERIFHELIGALGSANVNCRGLIVGGEVASTDSDGRISAYAKPNDPMIKRLQLARRAAAGIVESKSADLVASHFALYTYPMLGKIRKLPLVVHFHGPWAAEAQAEGAGKVSTAVRRHIERSVYRRADRLIVLSRAFATILTKDYGVHEDRIRVIPGGIDVDRFDVGQSRAQAREQLGWPTDRPIVLCIRRLVHRMGLHDLIGAVDMLRRDVPDVLVLIAGKGYLREALEDRIRRQQLQNNVRLIGFVPDADIPLAYRSADLTVVPSVALEGFGLVAAESLAAGTPAIVTPVGGLGDTVRELAPQLVLRETGCTAIYAGLHEALSGKIPLPSAQDCRAYAHNKFSWRIVGSAVAAEYRQVIGGN